MDSEQLNVHVSIQKGFSVPPLLECDSCCPPGKIHCPFCLPAFFKPTKPCKVRIHLDKHLKRAIYIGEHTIHRCRLECRRLPHFHCLYCRATLIRKRDFTRHLPVCCKAQMRRPKICSQLQRAVAVSVQTEELDASVLIPGESDIPTSDTESEDDSSDIIIQDQDDQNSEGEGSSVISKSNQCGTAGTTKRSTEPDSSKNKQTVSSNVEKPQDCDEHYFMSLVKMFKRLSPQKKAEVRMKIERLLFEAEFE